MRPHLSLICIASVLALFAPAVAEAAFRVAPPGSMRLSDAPRTGSGSTGFHLLGEDPDEDPGYPVHLSPPPLVSAPGGKAAKPPVEKPATRRPAAPRASDRLSAPNEIPVATRMAEILLASGSVLVLDLVAGGTLMAGFLFAIATGGSAIAIGLIVVAVLEELILPPVAAALGVSLGSDRPEEGGFGRALLWGYALHGAMIVVGLVASTVASVAGGNSALQVVSPLVVLGGGFVHLIGIPLVASYGYHQHSEKAPDDLRPAQLPKGSDRARVRVLQSPTDHALAEHRTVAMPLAAFAF